MTATADHLTHAPNCPRPGVTTEQGFSVVITRCLGCGAIQTTRNGTQ
jgi:flavoprotein